MKRIHSSQNPVITYHFKNILENHGIICHVRNENLMTALGGLPMSECWVELWILDESRYSEAKELLHSVKNDMLDRSIQWPWKCRFCGEELEEQFTACWNCGEIRKT